MSKNSQFDGEYEFKEGAMWEDESKFWIRTSVYISKNCGTEPCKHCYGHHTVQHTRHHDGSSYEEQMWICPKVVIVNHSDACGSTGLCLDCLLEAAEYLKGKI